MPGQIDFLGVLFIVWGLLTTLVGVSTLALGVGAVALITSANRDGAKFPDADQMDITRDPTGHLAFGYGIHYCVGAPLARMEGEIALRRLLDRFPGLALTGDPEQLRWRPSTLMRGLESLPVRLR